MGRQIGYDLLGLLHPKTDAKGIAANLPDGSTIGVLDVTFGEDLSNLETLLKTGKVKRVRVHMVNAVRARNKNAYSYDYAYKLDSKGLDKKLAQLDPALFAKLKLRIGLYIDLATRYSSVEWLFSPLLEHDQGEKAWKAVASVLMGMWPDEIPIRLVNCPHSGWKGSYGGSYLERHGANPSGGNCSSLDGESIYSLSRDQRKGWRERTKKQKYTLSWSNQCNGKKEGDNSKGDPRKRKSFLTAKDFKKLIETTKN